MIHMKLSPQPKFSFMSANFLGREKGYQDVRGFGDPSVQEYYAPASTYAERIDQIFMEIAAMGYRGVDLWTAHCHPQWATSQHIDAVLSSSARHQLELVSIAGGLNDDLKQVEQACKMAKDLQCPLLGLGCRTLPHRIQETQEILQRYGIKLAFENHPAEVTPEIVLEKIGHGHYPNIGTAFDTGWWGTHDYPVLKALDILKDHLLLVHLKNVEAPGAHVAARFDQGVLDLKSVVLKLREMQYDGWISLEYEPMHHNPTEDCRAFLKAATEWWNS